MPATQARFLILIGDHSVGAHVLGWPYRLTGAYGLAPTVEVFPLGKGHEWEILNDGAYDRLCGRVSASSMIC